MATPARAEPQPSATERAMAESLFRDAKKLLARGKTPEACEKLKASFHLDAAGGTLMNLAMCHEIEGKTATAWTEFNEALAAAKKGARADREKAAREHLGTLEPRLSHVTVSVPAASASPGLTVTLDGTPIEANALGTPIAVDPGEHTTSAAAPGRLPWETKVTLHEAEARALVVPPLAAEVVAALPPPPAKRSRKRSLGISAVAAGVVLTGVGTGFGVRAIMLGSQAGNQCPNHLCSPAGLAAVNDGRSAAAAANGTIAAGAVFAVGGAVLLVLAALDAPAVKPASARAPVSPGLARGLQLLAGRGSF